MERIKRLTVELDDGSIRTWVGRGTVSVNPTEVLSASRIPGQGIDATHVTATVQFDKEEQS